MVTLQYRLFDQCYFHYFQVFLCANIRSSLQIGLCKGQRQPCTGKITIWDRMLKALTIFSTIYSFHIEYFTDYTARETKLCLLDQLTAVVKNSNEDSSQTHKAQNGTILGRKSHKPFKNDHARLRISTANQRSLHEWTNWILSCPE